MQLKLGSASPKICLSLTEPSVQQSLAVVERERHRIDVAELRLDVLSDEELRTASSFPRTVGLPTVLSFRRHSEGGRREIDERSRVACLDRALEGRWAFIDLEEDLEAAGLEAKAAARGVRIIRSFHDFHSVPTDLSGRLERLGRKRGEIRKAAVMPRSTGDLLRILEAADAAEAEEGGASPLILIGMGDWGVPTRLLPGRFSSSLSYCTVDREPAVPAQVSPDTLRKIYRHGEIGPNSHIYCIVGNPVLHSRSPWIHNPAFRELGLDAVYVPIQVDFLSDFMRLANRLPIDGASITVPHKEKVKGFISSSDDSVETAGACNTLVRFTEGWKGFNTDIEGFLAPLKKQCGSKLTGSRALVIGAGGAARSVVAALVGEGCRVTVVNRTRERAAALAKGFGCDWSGLEDPVGREAGRFEIVVQATSVGMTPNAEGDPLPGFRFSGEEILYELIYSPPRTRFMERAAKAGCAVIGGREMLIDQARAQFRLFTGRSFPADLVIEDF